MVMQIKRSVRWVKATTAGSALPCAGSPKKPLFSLFKVATFRMGVSSVAIHVAIAALHKYVYFLFDVLWRPEEPSFLVHEVSVANSDPRKPHP
jgi:hypothetical protein